MPEKKEGSVSVDIRRGESDGLVHYGFVQDGVFHPIGAERQGDFDERVKAHQEDEQ